jgi:hypothetical protein
MDLADLDRREAPVHRCEPPAMKDAELDWIDVRREVMDDFNATLQRELDGVVVWQASCNGHYRSASGRIVIQWPHNFSKYRARIDCDSLASFECGRVGA